MELTIAQDAFDRIAKKQKLSSSNSQEVIDQVSQEIEHALAKIQSVDALASPDDQKSILGELKQKLDAIGALNQLEASQKELNINIVKYPKLLEKSFNPNISRACRNVDYDVHVVNKVIVSHFYRQGLFDLGDCLIAEAGEPEAIALRSQFLELHQILEAIKLKNLGPALNWVCNNREKLKQIGTKIELKLHRMQFVEILQKGSRYDTLEALNYAKIHLAPLASIHMKELQKIIVCILWTKCPERNPYPELLCPTHWDKLAEELTRDFSNLMGQPFTDPLTVVIAAGIEGLPTLLKLANVMAAKRQEWQTMKQLPVPVELGNEFQFHSIFVCPVSRDQSSNENPPMLMPCSHVLCKQSIMKLSKGSNSRSFKCPYCPAEASVPQCRQLYF